jgi:hypothetical protein
MTSRNGVHVEIENGRGGKMAIVALSNVRTTQRRKAELGAK